MKSTARFLVLTLILTTASAFSTLYGASPNGFRGGELSAAEKAQQKLLRQLRRDIAIHRILSRQKSIPVSRNTPKLKSTEEQSKILSTNINNNHKNARLSSAKACSNTVDNCFLKLESLFEEHFGEEFQLTESVKSKKSPLTQAGI